MKILQTPIRFSPAIGGVEKYVLDLSKELVKNKYDVTVICANDPKSDIENIDGIKVKRLRYFGKLANTNLHPSFPFKILKEKFDIMHTHMPTPWSADMSALISKIKRKPLILTYHNDLIKTGFAKIIATIYNKTFLKLVLRASDKIIITQPDYINHSKHLKKYEDKIVVLPNAVDINIFKKRNLKKKNNSIFFLSVLDEFHRYKGLDYLLKSIKEIKKTIPSIKLYVAGKGKLLNEYKELAKELGVEKNVEFLGFVSDDDLIKYYNQSEIFVLPSIDHCEGFGIVLLEALACKTPVISTTIVGVAKDVKKENCGLIIKPKDSKILTKSILKLLGDSKLRKEMGERGCKLVHKKYSWKKVAKDMGKLYREVLRK